MNKFSNLVIFLTLINVVKPQTDQFTSDMNDITTKLQALIPQANSISIINGPLILIGQGPLPTIISGLSDVVREETRVITYLNQGSPNTVLGDVNAFYALLKVLAALLDILIGKAGLFQTVPFIGQPVAAVLRQVESVTDTLAFTATEYLKNVDGTKMNSEQISIDAKLVLAINAYDGLSL